MMPARQPLVAPNPPDVLSDDEKSEDITDDEVASPNETDVDREAREKCNKLRQGHLRWARRRCAAQRRYQQELEAYNQELHRRWLAKEADA